MLVLYGGLGLLRVLVLYGGLGLRVLYGGLGLVRVLAASCLLEARMCPGCSASAERCWQHDPAEYAALGDTCSRVLLWPSLTPRCVLIYSSTRALT